MAELAIFNVFLTFNSRLQSFKDTHPNGIPCTDFLEAYDENQKPLGYAFIVDTSNLAAWQIAALKEELCQHKSIYNKDGIKLTCFIPHTSAFKVFDRNNKEVIINHLNDAALVVKNAASINRIVIDTNGSNVHLLIVGLQQALFIKPNSTPSINDHILTLAVDAIKRIAGDKTDVKRAYLTGFPDDYVNQAREMLLV